MNKNIKNKTIDEIIKTYPLENQEYDILWEKIYTEEEEIFLEEKNEGRFKDILRISHIGNTSIKEMIGKPVIEILLEIRNNTDINNLITEIENLGYIINIDDNFIEPNLIGYKGYDEIEKNNYVIHLYIRYLKKWDEHYFRDHLNRNEISKNNYIKLKLELKDKYKDNIEEYNLAKDSFIKNSVEKEKEEYKKYLEELNNGRS